MDVLDQHARSASRRLVLGGAHILLRGDCTAAQRPGSFKYERVRTAEEKLLGQLLGRAVRCLTFTGNLKEAAAFLETAGPRKLPLGSPSFVAAMRLGLKKQFSELPLRSQQKKAECCVRLLMAIASGAPKVRIAKLVEPQAVIRACAARHDLALRYISLLHACPSSRWVGHYNQLIRQLGEGGQLEEAVEVFRLVTGLQAQGPKTRVLNKHNSVVAASDSLGPFTGDGTLEVEVASSVFVPSPEAGGSLGVGLSRSRTEGLSPLQKGTAGREKVIHVQKSDACLPHGAAGFPNGTRKTGKGRGLPSRTSVKPDMHTYRAAIDACARNGATAVALSILDQMLQIGPVPNVFVFNAALNACVGNTSLVLDIFALMQKFSVPCDAATINIIFKSCATTEDVQTALELYTHLKHCQAAPQPGVLPKSPLVPEGLTSEIPGRHGLTQSRDPPPFPSSASALREAPWGLRQGIEDSVHNGVSRSKIPRKEDRWVARLENKDIGQDREASALQAAGHVQASGRGGGPDPCTEGAVTPGKLSSLFSLLDSAQAQKSSGKDQSEALPLLNVVSYTTVIKILADAKLWHEAVTVKEDMDAAGVVANVWTWTALISAFAKAGLVERAFSTFEEMCQAGVEPNTYSCNALLDACAEAGQEERAVNLLEEMKRWQDDGALVGTGNPGTRRNAARPMCAPDKVSYNTVIKACIRSPAQAEVLLGEMLQEGIPVDGRAWVGLMDAYGTKGDLKGALRVLEGMKGAGITPDVVAYTALIKACARAHDWDRAFDYYEELKAEGIVPNLVTFSTLLRPQPRAARMPARAEQSAQRALRGLAAYDDMRRAGYGPNDLVLKSLMGVWAEGVLDTPMAHRKRRAAANHVRGAGNEKHIVAAEPLKPVAAGREALAEVPPGQSAFGAEGSTAALSSEGGGASSGVEGVGFNQTLRVNEDVADEAVDRFSEDGAAMRDSEEDDAVRDPAAALQLLRSLASKVTVGTEGYEARHDRHALLDTESAAGADADARCGLWDDLLEIDLHGLSRAEARMAVLLLLRLLWERAWAAGESVDRDLVIITGAGRRSSLKGHSVLREAVLRVLQTELRLTVLMHNATGVTPTEGQYGNPRLGSSMASLSALGFPDPDTTSTLEGLGQAKGCGRQSLPQEGRGENQHPKTRGCHESTKGTSRGVTPAHSEAGDSPSAANTRCFDESRYPTNPGRLVVPHEVLNQWIMRRRPSL